MSDPMTPERIATLRAGVNPACTFIQRGDFYDCVHSAGGRGTEFERCCESCQSLILTGIVTMGAALAAHDRWCGHFADAPGDGIINRALDAYTWMGDWARHHSARLGLLLERIDRG